MSLTLQGRLEGHTGWVTSMSVSASDPNMLLSGSRDKSLVTWNLERTAESVGHAVRRLRGHNQAVSDCALSNNCAYALSSSWDGSLRLWDAKTGQVHRKFIGHTKDVNSVAFSSDNRTIASAGRDGQIKLWNALGECKFTIPASRDWMSKVRFAPNNKESIMVSSSWDKAVKVWNVNDCNMKHELEGHTGAVTAMDVAVDGTLCVTGGRDGTASLWDISTGLKTFSIECGAPIVSIEFCTSEYLLAVATENAVKIYNLEDQTVSQEIPCPDTIKQKQGVAWCTCAKWSADGRTLFCGAIDGNIYVYSM